MEKVTHICTHCGYEGKPVRPPSDDTSGAQGSDASKAIARLANLILPGVGLLIRPMAIFITLPIRLLLWPLKRSISPAKHCPHCGLPLMVSLKSDAGWLAKRKLDIKAGLIKVEVKEEDPLVFGREIILPGDRKKPEKVDAPRPTKLPKLEELLAPSEPSAPAPPEPNETPAPPPKKTIDPDAW